MESTNRIFPSAASEPIDLTMDAFCPVEPPLRLPTDSGPAPKEDRLPYAWQDPHSAAHVVIKTPGGSYESDNIHIDEAAGEITVDADGVRILLDGRNVVVYLNTERPTVYWEGLCDVAFTV